MAVDRSRMDDAPPITVLMASAPDHSDETPDPAPPAVEVVFKSDASCHPLFWLISLAPASTLLCIWYIHEGETITEREKLASVVLIWITCAIIFGYLLVLPKKFEVMSDGSVNITTYVIKKWRFQNVCAAYDFLSFWPLMRRLNVLPCFACDCDNCVLVKRNNGAWDLLVSPQDPAGFVNAIWRAVREEEGWEESESTTTATQVNGRSKK